MAETAATAFVEGPIPKKRPVRLSTHGDVRVDDWWWLRERSDPEVVAHLEAENRHTDAYFARLAGLQQRLFESIKARVKEDDVSVPVRHHDWWYWTATREGEQYARYFRQRALPADLSPRELVAMAEDGRGTLILDENELADGSDYFALGVFDITADQRLLAYGTDRDGSERYLVRFIDLEQGVHLADEVTDVYYGSAWTSDNRTFFYVRPDEAMRPYQIWRHRLGSPSSSDTLVYEELDERFFVSVGLTRSERFLLIQCDSKLTSEWRYLAADQPDDEPTVVYPRRHGVEYSLEHAIAAGDDDVWLLRSNEKSAAGEEQPNFALYLAPIAAPHRREVLIAHDLAVKIEGVDAFSDFAVVTERAEGLERLRVITLDGRGSHLIEQPDPVFSLTGSTNPEWQTKTYRFGYTSLVTPVSTIAYDVATRERTTLKVQPVLGGYEQHEYETERVWARAEDGTLVPISIVSRAGLAKDGSAPLVLYGYGSYEASIDPTFSIARLNLLERGVRYAIAHVRGGGEMGRQWHEQGRLSAKAHTFTDFIACAEHLLAGGYAAADRLAVRGASAGGLLIGAVLNARPELFCAAVAEVPFVDVVSTMSDPSLPLTVTEWEEWGNPLDDEAAYRLMKSYSPYDNVRTQAYPAILATGGLNDPRVGYWEPAKWVAKLREHSTSGKPILLRTELGAGHGGPSGRYDAWLDEARVQAFILHELGIDD